MRVDPCTSCVFVTIFIMFDILNWELMMALFLSNFLKNSKLHDKVKTQDCCF